MSICKHCGINETDTTRHNPTYCKECIKKRVWNHTRKFSRVCKECGKSFIANVGNAEYCSDLCKSGGVRLCSFCGEVFIASNRTSKYCKKCADKKSFLIGQSRASDVVNKINESRRQWISSPAGKSFYKKLGRRNSKHLKAFFTTDAGKLQIDKSAKLQSVKMKKRIKDGSWTPNIHNRWTHWDATIVLGDVCKKFRSSWEACVWFCNQSWEYEKIRVPLGTRSVITDFVDTVNKTVYEIKPKSMYRKEKHKINAIIYWCKKNGYRFIWLNEYNIMKYIDTAKFDGNINIVQLEKMKNGLKCE